MTETFQLNESAALVYEEQKVPAIFAPLADATFAKLDVSADDVALDLAAAPRPAAETIFEPRPKQHFHDQYGQFQQFYRATRNLSAPQTESL